MANACELAGIDMPDTDCELRCVQPHYRCAKGQGEYGGNRGHQYFRFDDGTGYYQDGFVAWRDYGHGGRAGQRFPQAGGGLLNLNGPPLLWSSFMTTTPNSSEVAAMLQDTPNSSEVAAMLQDPEVMDALGEVFDDTPPLNPGNLDAVRTT